MIWSVHCSGVQDEVHTIGSNRYDRITGDEMKENIDAIWDHPKFDRFYYCTFTHETSQCTLGQLIIGAPVGIFSEISPPIPI